LKESTDSERKYKQTFVEIICSVGMHRVDKKEREREHTDRER
jgi:hypothetical protein